MRLFILFLVIGYSVSLSQISQVPRNVFLSQATAFTVGVNALHIEHAFADTSDEGYITTPRGIKYKVMKPPTDPESPKPVRAQKVKASYTLYLNGFPEDTSASKKIDSSKGVFVDTPFEFLAGVCQVIKGWDLSVLDMKAGEARRLIIPSDLGYGDQGAGKSIPGGSTLYFDIELIERGPLPRLTPEQTKWLEDHPL